MPLADIAGEVLGGLGRGLVRVLVEGVFELLIQGTGRWLVRLFRPGSEPGETASAVVGLVFWAGVVAGGIWLHRHLGAG